MSQQKHDPKVEWGFYAITPRIVRTQYKDCSHAEKWLYTCLKDLCGNKGTCFRTLRSLSEETGISIASLSTMIPHLHTVGLIHAEKKSRGRGGKEVWHISIVDIWQANKDYCSNIEQLQGNDVQNLNNTFQDVQNLNKVPESCSEFERSCSNFSDRRITNKNNSNEEDTREREHDTPTGASSLPFDASRSPQPSSYSESATRSTMTTSNESENTHEHPIPYSPDPNHLSLSAGNRSVPDVTRHTGHEEDDSLASHNTNPSEDDPDRAHGRLGAVRVEKGHGYADRPVDSIEPSNTGLPDTLASVTSQVPLLAEAHPVETPPRLAVESGRGAALSTPETPAPQPQPAHADHSAVSAVVDARSLPAIAPTSGRQESTSKARGKKAQAEPTEPKAPPAQPASEATWNTRKCLAWFDYWRGAPLIGKFKLMQASTSAKGLAENYTEEQVLQVRTAMEDDPYYAQRGGCDVCDVANNIHKYLKKLQSKPNAPHLQVIPGGGARSAATMPAQLSKEPLVVWKPPVKAKQPIAKGV